MCLRSYLDIHLTSIYVIRLNETGILWDANIQCYITSLQTFL